MERALVVLDSTEASRRLLREAGELAAGVDASLVLLSLESAEELGEDLEALSAISSMEGTGIGEESIIHSIENYAEETGDDVLADIDVEYTGAAGVYDDQKARTILEAADSYGCDHVFITGRKRSRTGKFVFGDTAQSVLLNFEGNVTVSLD